MVSYYDWRMGIEEQFRDVKGHRFGMKLRWTQFTRADTTEKVVTTAALGCILRALRCAKIRHLRFNVYSYTRRTPHRHHL